MYDFKTVQIDTENESYLSTRHQRLYDCAEERVRVLKFTHFSANMTSGKVGYSSPAAAEGKWEPVPPGTVDEALWTFACGKQ